MFLVRLGAALEVVVIISSWFRAWHNLNSIIGLLFLVIQLIGGLADEKGRWEESIVTFDKKIDSIVGDVLISSGVIAYLGVFTVSTRAFLA